MGFKKIAQFQGSETSPRLFQDFIHLDMLLEDCDTSDMSLIDVRVACLFRFQFSYCELSVKQQRGGDRKYYPE